MGVGVAFGVMIAVVLRDFLVQFVQNIAGDIRVRRFR